MGETSDDRVLPAPDGAGFALGPVAVAAGFRVHGYEAVGSTNPAAMAAGRRGDSGDLWAVTTRQTSGRGRRGRAWTAPAGNLAGSLLKVMPQPAHALAPLGFVAGLAAHWAISAVCLGRSVADAVGGDVLLPGLELKWPNDLLLDGGKLVGILLEADRLADGMTAVVIGIGINVVHTPQGTPYKAASLAEAGYAVDAAAMFSALSDAWVSAERLWDEGAGFSAIRAAWLARARGVGGRVRVQLGDGIIEGVFETLDGGGHLVVRGDDGRVQTVAAGDVHFGVAATAG